MNTNLKSEGTILIGKSEKFKKVLYFIKVASKVKYPVLLLGETGVGKELIAKKIHELSDRKDKSFIAFNCTNIPIELFESELFGYKKGAFTDARENKQGLLEVADKGTFFFDEISESSPLMQAKLLRFIENGEIKRLGDNIFHKIDLRFIFASNIDLQKMIERKNFRKDLYFRISVLNLYVPPLRDRKQDIPHLIRHIIKKETRGKREVFLSKEVLDKLLEYNYPGNIRELENVIKRALVFSNNNKITTKEIIFEKQNLTKKGRKSKLSFNEVYETVQKCDGNKTHAAKELGISRQWISEILKRKSYNKDKN